MTEKNSKSKILNSKPGKAPQKRRGRKSVPRKAPPGRGAISLRSSVNSLVSRAADLIAQALIKETLGGNMTGARILVELTGADKPPAPEKKKRRGPSDAELMMMDDDPPEWNADQARLLELSRKILEPNIFIPPDPD